MDWFQGFETGEIWSFSHQEPHAQLLNFVQYTKTDRVIVLQTFVK